MVDEMHAMLVMMGYSAMILSVFLAPSSILATEPTSLLLAAGITAAPVLLHLLHHPIVFELIPLLITILFGTVSLFVSRPQFISPPQIHRLTHPISTLLTFLVTPISPSSLLSLLPLPLLYYGH